MIQTMQRLLSNAQHCKFMLLSPTCRCYWRTQCNRLCFWTVLQQPLTTCIHAKLLQWLLTNLATQSNQIMQPSHLCCLHPDEISTLAQLLQSTCKAYVHVTARLT